MSSQKRFSSAKIVIFGSSGVGKTAFAVRYITKRFIGDYDKDREMVYTYKLPTAREISLEILDTASQCSEETLERHIKWGDGFILMYSVTDKDSIVYIQKIKDQLAKTKCLEDFPIVLVGNKSDLVLAREIENDDVEAVFGGLNCSKFEISVADECQSVNEVMEELLCLIKREFVKANASSPVDKKSSKLYNHMRKAFKKINKSHSDTF